VTTDHLSEKPGNVRELSKSQRSIQENSLRGKLFIGNFTFGAAIVFSTAGLILPVLRIVLIAKNILNFILQYALHLECTCSSHNNRPIVNN